MWKSTRLFNEIEMHTGMTIPEINQDMKDKQNILDWMLKNDIRTVNSVGRVIAEYYNDKSAIIDVAAKNKSAASFLGDFTK